MANTQASSVLETVERIHKHKVRCSCAANLLALPASCALIVMCCTCCSLLALSQGVLGLLVVGADGQVHKSTFDVSYEDRRGVRLCDRTKPAS